MNTAGDEFDWDDPRVNAAIQHFLESQDRGEPIEPDSWLNGQPVELRPHLQAFLGSLDLIGAVACPPSPPSVSGDLPAQFDGYAEPRLLARGGMGAVYLVRDLPLDRPVAVKVLRSELNSPAWRQRFEEEARTAARLQHPGIAPVHARGVLPDGRPYFAMKLVSGRTLAEAIAEHHQTPLPGSFDRLLRQFISVCETVAFAHDLGVLHRDLKPANIMAGAYGEVQVMDWGLGKRHGASADENGDEVEFTQRGTVSGTFAYMPPEQADPHGSELDVRADVFALGAILCEILTGLPPYVSDLDDPKKNRAELWRQARAADTSAARQRIAAVSAPPPLADLIIRCLAANRDDRPGNASDVAANVSAYLAGVQEQLREREVEMAEARTRAIEERKRRHWQLALGGAVVLAIIAAAGGWIWYDGRESRRREEATRTALVALNKARELHAQAAASPETSSADIEARQSTYRQEELALEQAEAAAARQALPAELRDGLTQARRELDDAKRTAGEQLQQRLREERLLAGLHEANRLVGARSFEFRTDFPSAARGYLAALKEFGLDVLGAPVAQTAQQVDVLSPRVRPAVLEALHELIVYQSGIDARPILDVLGKISNEPFGEALRTAIVDRNTSSLIELANRAQSDDAPPKRFELIGAALREIGAKENAITFLRAAQLRFPGDYGINVELGNCLTSLSPPRFAEAAGCFRAALAVEAKSPIALSNLGLVYMRLGELNAAEQHLRRALAVQPDCLVARINLGVFHLYSRLDARQAEAEAKQVAAAGIDNPDVTALLGICEILQGKVLSAQKQLEAVHQRDPANPMALLGLMFAYHMRDRVEDAVRIGDQYARLYPQSELGAFLRTFNHLQNGQAIEGEAMCRQALQRIPDGAGIWRTMAHGLMAYALIFQGRLKEAEDFARRALEQAPDFLPSLDGLFQTLVRQGRFGEAHEVALRMKQLSSTQSVLGWQYRQRSFASDLVVSWEKRVLDFERSGREPPSYLTLGVAETALVMRHGWAAVRLYESWRSGVPGFMRSLTSMMHTHEGLSHNLCSVRAAILAASGTSADGFKPTPEQATALRNKALTWLHEELAVLKRDATKSTGRPKVRRVLTFLELAAEFASVREPAMLSKLPEAERAAWLANWADIRKLKQQINAHAAASK